MDELFNPRISVCIPTYNCSGYVRQAIESALEQDCRNVEIVIVDNCSTDGTASVIEDITRNSRQRIRFFRNERNIGLVGNLNRCLEHARGEYIKFLMADDLLRPGCLNKMTAALDANASVSLVASARLIIDESGRDLAVRRHSAEDVLVPGEQAITECLFGSHYIGEPTAVMFRKGDLDGNFREDMPQVLDMDMWFRLLEHGNLLYLGEPLCAIRIHENQMTRSNVKSGALVDDNVRLFEIYSRKPYVNPSRYLVWKHRIYMTYRVWMSRRFMPGPKRDGVLKKYGSCWAYWLMPAGWVLLNLVRQLRSLYRKPVRLSPNRH